jgi:hypothetical protein
VRTQKVQSLSVVYHCSFPNHVIECGRTEPKDHTRQCNAIFDAPTRVQKLDGTDNELSVEKF